MRVILMFDLPSVTSAEMREYRIFRKFLIKNGFIMLQESIYSKLALNMTATYVIIEHIKQHKPPEGLVQLLTITEKQYNRMEFIIGNKKSDVVDSTERLIII